MSTYSIDDLLHLMVRLRDPQSGCPWDQQQTYRTIAPSTIEEAYEVVEAIESDDHVHLKEELGDLLFQVIFHSQIATEQSHFTFADVVDTLVGKLIRRHPHVFPSGDLSQASSSSGDTASADMLDVKHQWEAIKQAERSQQGAAGVLSGVSLALPALTRAAKLQKRAAHVGFDWRNVQEPIEKVREELVEVEDEIISGDRTALEEEVGDLLFAVVNVARHLKIDPEQALRCANTKFQKRFEYIETKCPTPLAETTLEDMDKLWNEAKVFFSRKNY